jgi:hypothetical protein
MALMIGRARGGRLAGMRSTSLLAAAAVTAALAAAPGADAATPSAGVYAGSLPTGKLAFKLGALSRRVIRVTATAQLTCPDGRKITDSWDDVVYGPKTDSGSFVLQADGFLLRGRFTSKRTAVGTLDREKDGCTATGLKWKARRR